MAAAAESARVAVADARAAGAATWAPQELQNAEQLSRDALTAQRVEQTRLWPIPSAARVVDAYGAAERAAKTAGTVAADLQAKASTAATAQIETAHRLVSASEALAEKLRVGKERRSLLARARLAVEAARVYQRAGDYRNATVNAIRAEELNAQVQDHAAAAVARYADPATLARWRALDRRHHRVVEARGPRGDRRLQGVASPDGVPPRRGRGHVRHRSRVQLDRRQAARGRRRHPGRALPRHGAAGQKGVDLLQGAPARLPERERPRGVRARQEAAATCRLVRE